MRHLLTFLSLCFAVSIHAASRIAVEVTVTNPPISGATFALNGAVRMWTNSHSSTTILTNLVGVGPSATNLFNNYASYPVGSGITHVMTDTNKVKFTGPLGLVFTGTATGNWATITLTTQSGPSTYTALWPMENMVGETNRTNQGSALVYGLGIYSTNAFPTNSTATSNYITKGAHPGQIVSSPLTVGGALRARNGFYATNGFTSAMTNINPIITNGIAYGGFSSVGDGAGSEQFGNAAHARGDQDTALGATSLATNGQATVIGYGSVAQAGGTTVGAIATANTNSVAIGLGARAAFGGAAGNTVVGAGADDDGHENVILIGANSTATESNLIQIGTSGQRVSLIGVVLGPTQTNSTFKGTNVLNGRLDLTSRANTGLANGYNAGVVLGTNVYVRFSGPSGAYTNVGFAAGQDGTYHVAQFDNPGLSFTLLHDSGIEPTAANRIYTGIGASVSPVNSTNNPVMVHLIYDASVSRWRVVTIR